jgi:hypothetical protein
MSYDAAAWAWRIVHLTLGSTVAAAYLRWRRWCADAAWVQQ